MRAVGAAAANPLVSRQEDEPPNPSSPPDPSNAGLPLEAPPLLSMHAAVVFVVAGFLGLIMGCLMFLSERSLPTAVAAGLGTFGICVPVLHKLIG